MKQLFRQILAAFTQATIITALSCALASSARAQFSPNTVLTAAALNSALAAPAITSGSINGNTSILTTGAVTLNGTNTFGANTSGVTQNYLASSNLVATSQFVRQSILAASATIPIAIIGGGGTYNFASAGSGAIFGVTTSSGALASITGIVAGGTGYQVGDCLVMVGGNGDAVAYVSTVSSGVITAATVLYGGTGYSGTPQLSGIALPPGSRSGKISGTLTNNATIIVPAGTFLAGGRRFGFQNNTTGAFTITVKLSNGSGGSTGTGVVLPQGTSNSTSMLLYTDGVTDVWNESGAAPSFIVANTLTVNGRNVAGPLTATSASLGGSNLAAGSCASTPTTVTGAVVGNTVVGTPNTYPGDQFYWRSYISAANTVTTTVCNANGPMAAPTASVYYLRVMQ